MLFSIKKRKADRKKIAVRIRRKAQCLRGIQFAGLVATGAGSGTNADPDSFHRMLA